MDTPEEIQDEIETYIYNYFRKYGPAEHLVIQDFERLLRRGQALLDDKSIKVKRKRIRHEYGRIFGMAHRFLLENRKDLIRPFCSYFKGFLLELPLANGTRAYEIYPPGGFLPGVRPHDDLDVCWLRGDGYLFYTYLTTTTNVEICFDYCRELALAKPTYLNVMLRRILSNDAVDLDGRNHVQPGRKDSLMEMVTWWQYRMFKDPFQVRFPRLLVFDSETRKLQLSPMAVLLFHHVPVFEGKHELQKKFLEENLTKFRFPCFSRDNARDHRFYPAAFKPIMRMMLLIWKRLRLPKDVLLSVTSHYILWNCFQYEHPEFDRAESLLVETLALSRADYKKELVAYGFLPILPDQRFHSGLKCTQLREYLKARLQSISEISVDEKLQNFYLNYAYFHIPPESKIRRDELNDMNPGAALELLQNQQLQIFMGNTVQTQKAGIKIMKYVVANCSCRELAEFTIF